jgi:hypothetical protein
MRPLTRRHALQIGASSATLGAAGALGGGTLALGLAGCRGAVRWAGVDASSGQRVELAAGPMPHGASFTGSYLSPQCGHLRLVQCGTQIAGSYRSDDDAQAVGALTGEVTGNLAEFRWIEHELPNDMDPSMEGTGFFLLDVFTLVAGSVRLFGQRAFLIREGESSLKTRDGGPWTAVRIV